MNNSYNENYGLTGTAEAASPATGRTPQITINADNIMFAGNVQCGQQNPQPAPQNVPTTCRQLPPPQPPLFNSTHDVEREEKDEITTVISDTRYRCMLLMICNDKDITHEEFQSDIFGVLHQTGAHSSSKHKSKITELCRGVVEARGQITYVDELMKTVHELHITLPDGSNKSVEISDETFRDTKLLKHELEENGIVFSLSNKTGFLLNYLKDNETNIPVKKVYSDFYRIDNSWRHDDSSHILEVAYEKDKCADEFCNGAFAGEAAKQKAFLLLLSAAYMIRKPLCDNGVVLGSQCIVLRTTDTDATYREIMKLTCQEGAIPLKKGFDKKLQGHKGQIAIMYAPDGTTPSMVSNLLQMLSENECADKTQTRPLPLIILITDNAKLFTSSRFLVLSYLSCDYSGAEGVCCRVKGKVIKDSAFPQQLSRLIQRHYNDIQDEFELEDKTKLMFAVVMGLYESMACEWQSANELSVSLSVLREYLLDTAEGENGSMIERVHFILTDKLPFPISNREAKECKLSKDKALGFIDKRMLCLTKKAIRDLAQECGCDDPKEFCSILKDNDVLLNDGKLQKKVNVPSLGGLQNLYCLSLSEPLYHFGEVLPETDEYAFEQPAIQLEIGIDKNEKSVFYTIVHDNGEENAHTFISGRTGMGKTTLLRTLINGAYDSKIPTVILDFDNVYSEFDRSEFSADNIASDECSAGLEFGELMDEQKICTISLEGLQNDAMVKVVNDVLLALFEYIKERVKGDPDMTWNKYLADYYLLAGAIGNLEIEIYEIEAAISPSSRSDIGETNRMELCAKLDELRIYIIQLYGGFVK